MSTTISLPKVAESVSSRLNLWLAGGSEGIAKRRRIDMAMKAGSLVALAATIVERAGEANQPVQIAVAPPLSLQPAFFSALASEIHYFSNQSVQYSFERKGFRRSRRWAAPKSIAVLLPFFASVPAIAEVFDERPVRLFFTEFTSEPESPVEVVLWAENKPAHDSRILANAVFVQMAPLYT
jgi:hypothetical protein